MNRILALNTAAVAALALADAPRLRVRAVDGALQIRPTDRENLSNLPAGEVLVNLTTKANARRATVPADLFNGINDNGKLVVVGTSHYGWSTLAASLDIPRGAPGASIL